MSILRLLLAFAIVSVAGRTGAGEMQSQRPALTIDLREGDRSILNVELPLAWGIDSEVNIPAPHDTTVNALASRTHIAGDPAITIMMKIKRGEGKQSMNIFVPKVILRCSGTASVRFDRPDDVAGPLYLTLAIDPAEVDASCTAR